MRASHRHPSTVAVVLVAAATDDGGAAALLEWEETTVLRRLLDQLASLHVGHVHVLTRPAFADAVGADLTGVRGLEVDLHVTADVPADLGRIGEIAADGDGTLVIVEGDVVTHREALAGLLADPRVATGVLSTGGHTGRPFAPRVRTRRGRVVGAGSVSHYCHHSTGGFLGVLKIAPAQRAVTAQQCARLRELAADPPPSWRRETGYKAIRWRHSLARTHLHETGRLGHGETAELAELDAVALPPAYAGELRRRLDAAAQDAASLVLVGLARAGVTVGNSYLRSLFWARPLSADDVADARERIQHYDEDKVLLDSAVKATDGFFTTFFVSPYSRYIARWAARRGLTPNQITTFSLALGVLTAAFFATGERWGLVTGAVLLQLAFTFDCVDGQLARYTRRFSKLGAWLDSVFDRTKEYVVFAGLAIGATRTGDSAWLLAGCALGLQTMRHLFDFSYAAAAHQTIAAEQPPPLEQSWDGHSEPSPPDQPRPVATVAGAAASPPPTLAKRLALGALHGWRSLDRARALPWIKRAFAFPIGERFAAISITAALWSAHVTFVVLLVWGGAAGLYALGGRLLRTVAR